MHPLLDGFQETVARHGARLAAGDPTLSLDYPSFQAAAMGLSRHVAACTQRPHVGILAPSSTVGALSIFACWYADKTPVPLNFLLAPEELSRIVRDAELDCAIAADRFAPLASAVGVTPLVPTPELLAPGRVEPPGHQPGDLAVILYTSGTTGQPKGVCLSFDNLVRNARACVEHARIDPQQVFLGVLPQFHCFGFTGMTITPLLLGASVHYLPRFSPLGIVQGIAQTRATVFMAVASMYTALAAAKSADRQAFASLRLAISGGEPLPRRTAEQFAQRFGIELLEGYGLTETSPVVTLNTPWCKRTGSVGRPLPGVQVQAVDPQGRPLGPDQEGELTVRGHCVMLGYYKRPQETAAVLRDGVLWTGDIGKLDADGFVYITGRAKELIIIGGENVAPREIEDVLLTHPAVAEAAVIGVPDELRGEAPLAWVILREGASATPLELREFCRQRLAGYKVPREVRIAADLPRSPTGKVLKRALSA